MNHIFVFLLIAIFMYLIFIIVDTYFSCEPHSCRLCICTVYFTSAGCNWKAQGLRADGSSQMHLVLHASFLPQLLTLSITRHSSQRSASPASPAMTSRRPFMSLTRTKAASLRRMSWSKGLVLEFTFNDGFIFVWSSLNSQWAKEKLRPSGSLW